MAFMESAIVVYLRALYYPNGFDFPLAPIDQEILIVEVGRELATIVMLACVGLLVGRSRTEQFAWFIFAFAIWDIFYYVFLKILLDWPASLMTWDILFLIPTMWVGPVIAPLLLSALMILLAMILLRVTSPTCRAPVGGLEWTLLITGSLVIVTGFCMDFTMYVYERPDTLSELGSGRSSDPATSYVPRRFEWPIFLAGVGILLGAMVRLVMRHRAQPREGH